MVKLPPDHKPKSKSQVLRAVLYRRWEIECGPKRKAFEDWYNEAMDRIINKEKSNLP